jgi:hypothetical protein
MSQLPQRRKSAEEIAKLRESLGIPHDPAADAVTDAAPVEEDLSRYAPEAVAMRDPLSEEECKVSEAAPLVPLPVPAAPVARPVSSLRKSERMPMLPSDEIPVPPVEDPVVVLGPKRVKSLRKSERVPLPVAAPAVPADSKLPQQRHSEEEIQRIRRQETFAMQAALANRPNPVAHLAWVIPGYLCAIGGAVSFYYYDLDLRITAACVALAWVIGTFIFFKKPLSRHHAGFILVMGLFVVVFGTLHYFPQLRHGS